MPGFGRARVLFWPGIAGLLLLGGCSSLLTEGSGAGAGVASAAVANAVSANGAVTTGIGLGAQAAAMAGTQYLERRVHATEQDDIAAVAGTVPVGGVAPWSVVHRLPIERNEHGELTVTRMIAPAGLNGVPRFLCKEIIFSVDSGKNKAGRDFYTADVCRDGTQWKWATAEPATERWGALQ